MVIGLGLGFRFGFGLGFRLGLGFRFGFGLACPVALLLHVLGHAWQALLATEEAVRDELLYDRLLAHEVDAIGPRAQHEHVRRTLGEGGSVGDGLEEHGVR